MMNLEKSINALVKERVKVKQHLRSEHGKVSTVKQHMREQEVNPDKNISNKTQDQPISLEEFINRTKGFNPNSITGKDFVDLYRYGPNTIFDIGMKLRNDKIDEAFDSFQYIINTYYNSEIPKLFDQNTVKSKFVNENYISNVSNKVDDIEKVFNKDLNIKTERVSPFTFKIKYELEKPYSTDQKWLKNRISSIIDKANIGKLNNILEKNFWRIISSTIRMSDTRFNNKNISKKEATKQLSQDLFDDICTFFPVHLENKYNLKNVNYGSEILYDIEQQDEQKNTDGEKLRKKAKEIIDKSFKDKMNNDEYKELINQLKRIKPQQVEPFLKRVGNGEQIPTTQMMNEIYDPLLSFSNQVADRSVKEKKEMENVDMYISKNPMELLTMSPTGNFESCQSIFDDEGYLTAGIHNANIISAAYGDHNHDFIMFTTKNTKDGLEKASRASFSYDKNDNKIYSFENFRTYGSISSHVSMLNDFISKHDDVFEIYTQNNPNLSRLIKDVGYSIQNGIDEFQIPKAKKINDIHNKIKDNINIDNRNEYKKKIDSIVKSFTKNEDKLISSSINSIKDKYKTEIVDLLTKEYEPYIYSTPMHGLFEYNCGQDDVEINKYSDRLFNFCLNKIHNLYELIPKSKNSMNFIEQMEYVVSMNAREPVKVRQHIRKEKGKVVNIKEHIRMQEVNLNKEELNKEKPKEIKPDVKYGIYVDPDVFMSIPKGELDDIIKDNFAKGYPIKQQKEYIKALIKAKKDGATPEDIMNIYRIGKEHTIHDVGMEKNKQNQETSYDYLSEVLGDDDWMKETTKGLFGQNVVKNRLTDQKIMKDIRYRVDTIEKLFQEKFGVETSRIDPFTFKFDQILNIKYKTNREWLHKELKSMISGFGVDDHDLDERYQLGRLFFSNIDRRTRELDDALVIDSGKKLDINIKQIKPMQFFMNIAFTYGISKLFSLNPVTTKLASQMYNIEQSIMSNFKGEHKSQYDIDPEVIRKKLKKEISNSDSFKECPEILKNLKEMKPQYIRPFIEFVTRKGYIPTKEFMEKVYDPIQKLIINISSQAKKTNKNGTIIPIYVSKNPFEFLTMSPSGNFESCQSVSTPTGKHNVTTYNMNMINAIYGSNNHDFIMYTTRKTDKGLEKASRISLNYNIDEIQSYENNKVYGGDSDHIENLHNFIIGHQDKINGDPDEEDVENDINNKIYDKAYSEITEIYNSLRDFKKEADKCIEDRNKTKYKEILKNVSNLAKRFASPLKSRKEIFDKAYNSAINESKSQINNILHNYTKSMLYGSEFSTFLCDPFDIFYSLPEFLSVKIRSIGKDAQALLFDLSKQYRKIK